MAIEERLIHAIFCGTCFEYTRPHSLYVALRENLVPKHLITEAWSIVENLPMRRALSEPLADPGWRHNDNPWQQNALREWEEMG